MLAKDVTQGDVDKAVEEVRAEFNAKLLVSNKSFNEFVATEKEAVEIIAIYYEAKKVLDAEGFEMPELFPGIKVELTQ